MRSVQKQDVDLHGVKVGDEGRSILFEKRSFAAGGKRFVPTRLEHRANIGFSRALLVGLKMLKQSLSYFFPIFGKYSPHCTSEEARVCPFERTTSTTKAYDRRTFHRMSETSGQIVSDQLPRAKNLGIGVPLLPEFALSTAAKKSDGGTS